MVEKPPASTFRISSAATDLTERHASAPERVRRRGEGGGTAPGRLAAIVLADAPMATARVAGLSMAERGERVARHVGAAEVFVVRDAKDRERLRAWRPGAERVLVIRAGDQLVHTPLVKPLLGAEAPDAPNARDAVAVAPVDAAVADVAAGGYAGAFLTSRVAELLVELANGKSDAELARRLLDEGAARCPHGEIARHPVAGEAERAAAEKLLYRILIKPQDNAIARILFRPLSLPLTKLLARTPITPNQITTVTMVLVAIGLWLAASAEPTRVVLGSLVILVSSYVDCCDGEIARLKVLSSKLGAWYDTIVDEVSSLGYMLVLGWHCHLHFGAAYFGGPSELVHFGTAFGRPIDAWLLVTAAGAVTYLVSLYCVYFNIVLVARSANSQDYVSKVEVVAGATPGSWELRPVPQKPMTLPAGWPRWLVTVVAWVPNIVRRDFIVWASLLLVAAGLTHVVFFAMVGGGVGTTIIVGLDHLKLRGQMGLLRERAAATDATPGY